MGTTPDRRGMKTPSGFAYRSLLRLPPGLRASGDGPIAERLEFGNVHYLKEGDRWLKSDEGPSPTAGQRSPRVGSPDLGR